MRTPPSQATSLYTDAATGQLVERHFRIVVTGGPDEGLQHGLDGTVMVGSHENNDLVLSDNTVSRYHLELQVRREGLFIKDLDSTNGTFHYAGGGKTRIGSITVTGSVHLRLGKHTEVSVEPLDDTVDLDAFEADHFGGVLGAAPVMRDLFALLERVSPTEATVLLEGETGTGKEAIAEAVHRASNRADGPFVVVDCGAIPHELIGSELFGHVRGAYTGAAADKVGLIETASGGTLFLDEIGELALDLQPQLLRVLEKRQVRRVGDTRSVDVDIRIVAATHRDLKALSRSGDFREDLYYRLAVVRAVIPPLRSRTADIPLLAHHFAVQLGRGDFAPPPSLISALERHDWPGNVRELRNVVERALSLGNDALPTNIRNAPLSRPGAPAPAPAPAHEDVLDLPFKEAKSQLVESFEREYLSQLLARHRGNISQAASEAGIDRNYIHRLVKKYGLSVPRE